MLRRPLITLVGITLVAAFIRFLKLSSPCLWGDEAEVYWRTCGTFGQLLDVLRLDGFSPLHYEMHWVIGRVFGIKPTPFVLRFVPAICGVAMVPAVYFLARQLVDRGASLMAALVTACSAYLVFYSRDAKMYAETWLLVTLFAGCLFWWFRCPKWTPWLCWVAAGCAAVGIHMSAAAVVGLSLLFVLTQSKMTWLKGLAWAGGVAVVMAGPVGYYGYFNTFKEVSEEDWQKSGLNWVDGYNSRPVDQKSPWPRVHKSGPDLWRFTGTAWSMAWEWPTFAYTPRPAGPDWSWRHPYDWTRGSIRTFCGWLRDVRYVIAADAVALLMIVGMLPWPRRWLAHDDTAPRPPWRSLLWILLWLLVPTYAFYCVSRYGFALPSDLLNLAGEPIRLAAHPAVWLTVFGFLLLAAIVPGLLFEPTRAASVRAIKTAVVAIAVVLLLQVMGMVLRPLSVMAHDSDRPWHDYWVPRYIGFVIPAVMIAMGTLLMRLPTVWFRIAAAAIVLGINLTIGGGRIFGQTEQPTDLMAADEYAAVTAPDHHILAWFSDPKGDKGPGEGNLQSEPGRYYLQMLAWRQPMTPEHFKASSADYPTRSGPTTYLLPAVVNRDKRIDRVIVWEHVADFSAFGGPKPDPEADDKLADKLPGWKLESDRWFDLHDFWTGRSTVRIHRRVFVRG